MTNHLNDEWCCDVSLPCAKHGRQALSTNLQRAAKHLLSSDEYLPGRRHDAEILAERIFHEVTDSRGMWGRATLLDLAASLYRLAGHIYRAEGCRMLCAAVMGTWFDGGSCSETEYDQNGKSHLLNIHGSVALQWVLS